MACIYDIGALCGGSLPGVYLLPMGPEFFENADHLARYRQFEMDARVTAWNSHGLFYKTAKQIAGWMAAIEAGSIISWAIMDGEKYIGVCSLDSINLWYRSAEITIFLGDIEYWKKGIATAAVAAMLTHGFQRLGLHRIWSGTAESNPGMNRVFEKLGFKQEGVFYDGMILNGEYENINCWSLLKPEWGDTDDV